MAESQQVKQIPLRLGMQQDNDVNAPLGTIEVARNVRFSSVGAATPRPGTAAISTNVTQTSPAIANSTEAVGALFSVGNAGALAVGGNVFAWDPVASKFEAQGNYSTCQPVRKRSALVALKESYGYRKYGMAVNSLGHVCYAAARNTTASVDYVIESKDGVRQSAGPLATYTKVSVLAFGTSFLLVAQAGTAIDGFKITYSAGTWTVAAAVNLATLNASTNHWDVCVESATVFHIFYQSGAAQLLCKNMTFPGLAAVGGSAPQAVTGQPVCSVWCDGVNVWLGWNDNPGVVGDVRMRVFTVGYAGVLAATTIATAATYGPLVMGPARNGLTSEAFGYFTEIKSAASPWTVGTHAVDLSTAGLVALQDTWHVYPVSKPGTGGRVWCMTSNKLRWALSAPLGWQFSRNLLLRWTDLATNIEPPSVELCTDEWEQVLTRPSVTDDMMLVAEANATASTFAMLADVVQVDAFGGFDTLRLQLYEYEKTSQVPLRDYALCSPTVLVAGQPIELWSKGSSGTAIPGSIVRSGITVGFSHRLAIVDAVQAGGGLLTATGTYSWVVVPEWIDPATGRLHQGAPSSPYTTTLTGANTQVTFTFTGIMADARCGDFYWQARPTFAVYRTRNGEAQLRRESTYTSTFDANVESATYVSLKQDAALGPFLYTEGGQVEFDLAPSCRHIRRTESSAWLGGLWDRRVLQKLREFFPGEPAESSDLDSWKVYLPEDEEGIAYQDGLTYVFSKRSIFIVTGDGPNEQGQGVFDPVRTLTSEFGCEQATSICETSIGVFFLSKRGFMLIPRGGGNPEFVGEGVQGDIRAVKENGSAGYTTCKGSAVISGESRTVRFLMSNGTSERVYIYDLDTRAWSYDDFRELNPDAGFAEQASRLAAIGSWPTGCVISRTDLHNANICAVLEDSTKFCDAGEVPITSYIKFTEMRLFGFIGWGRCQTVGYIMSYGRVDATGVPATGSVTPDALATSAISRTWTVTSAGDGQTTYRSIDEGHQQCSFIVVEWSTVRSTSAVGPGPSLNAIYVASTPEKGTRLLQTSER